VYLSQEITNGVGLTGGLSSLKNKIFLICVLTLIAMIFSSCNKLADNSKVIIQSKLNVLHVPSDVFDRSIMNARDYKLNGEVKCGVVPHHLVAADLIAGFFKSVKDTPYETVIIIAPDHSGGQGQAITTNLSWSVNTGDVVCDTALLSKITKIKGIDFVFDDNRLQNDHSASNLIPYVQHYIPKAMVITILLTNRIDQISAQHFAEQLYAITSSKKCLVMFSIDFSHYLMPHEAEKRDLMTKEAINNFDYIGISLMNNNFLDCPPALIIFLKYTQAVNGKVTILENTNASNLLNNFTDETTSYFVLGG
jgi:AmmeMemoRadiSam system protein B